MSTKNLVLIIFCVIGLLFVGKKIYDRFFHTSSAIQYYLKKGEMLAQWFKEHNIDSCMLSHKNDTLRSELKSNGISAQNPPKSDDPNITLNDIFKQANSDGVKCVVITASFMPNEPTDNLAEFLKNGGTIGYVYLDESIFNMDAVYKLYLDYMKKGQVCIIDEATMSNNKEEDKQNIIDNKNVAKFEGMRTKQPSTNP